MVDPVITHAASIELGGANAVEGDPRAFAASFDLGRAPKGPGCYIMLDAKGKPIYVGKAKDLRARLRAYLNETDSRYSVKFLMRRVARIEFLVTGTEKEALLLENNLIKLHRPRYNVQLKDDKTFISLRIDPREEFPRLTVVRRRAKDGARYFGPYHQAHAVRETLRWIQPLFPLRVCSDAVLHNRTRPCLYYEMKRCLAPCVGKVDRAAYHEIVQQVLLTLEGKNAEVERALLDQIRAHSERLEFEQAAALRDRLLALRGALERQRTAAVPGAPDRDVFGFYNEGRFTEIQILFYRGGRMSGGRVFSFGHHEMPTSELLSSFLFQYYEEQAQPPSEVLLPLELEEAEVLASVLTERRGARVELACPQRGEKRALVELAQRNARRSFLSKRMEEKADADRLAQLQEALGLPAPPDRIECFDISTLQGGYTVAAMAVMEGCQPAKARYRRFAIRGVAGQDDFASLREAITRRYTRAAAENDLPGLVLVDGGRGQLGVAVAALKDLGLDDLPCASIAKARAREQGGHSPERFFIPGRKNPIVLSQSSPAVHLVARVRDEAHRFAVTYHRKRRGAGTLRTALEDIPGIGPKRARALLNQAGPVAKIREMAAGEIARLGGISEKLAQAVLDHLRKG